MEVTKRSVLHSVSLFRLPNTEPAHVIPERASISGVAEVRRTDDLLSGEHRRCETGVWRAGCHFRGEHQDSDWQNVKCPMSNNQFRNSTLDIGHWTFVVEAGGGLLSHDLAVAVPSALTGLTTVFGMGTGVALSR